MKRKNRLNKWGLLCGMMLALWACTDDDGAVPQGGVCSRYRVAIVSRPEDRVRMARILNLFSTNISRAQQGMARRVELEAEWVDETEGWQQEVERIVADTAYRALIGPYASDNAAQALLTCARRNRTIVLPTATSAELQRAYAGKGYAWFLSEPDIAQCEIMLSTAGLNGSTGVYLLAADNSYGQTFKDWVGFQATELGMEVCRVWSYDGREELAAIVQELEEQERANIGKEGFRSLLFVPATATDLVALDSAMSQSERLPFVLQTICSDKACAPEAVALLRDSPCDYEGFSLSASPSSGFNPMYEIEYGEFPTKGEAQLYDALLLVYYGLVSQETHGDADLNEALKRLVDVRDGIPTNWMKDGIRTATADIRAGKGPNIEGACGTFEFDAKKYTTVLHSVFAHWMVRDGQIHHVGYNSTDPSLRTSSTTAVWNWARTFMEFDPNIHITYPKADRQWALIVATSTSWKNYRHQADAFAMYQMLKRHGYEDDHIVLIVSDGYAYNPQNLTPGEIRVRTGGANVYDAAAIDYDIKDLSPQDLGAILAGERSERLPHVLSPDFNDNVLVFWSGHGTYNSLPWRENGLSVSGSEIRTMLDSLSSGKRFAQMLFAIEACYSGSIGEQCEGVPGVLVMTAANSREASWAEQKDPDMHIYLSNAFTRTFEETIDIQPDIKLKDLYYNLARTTSGSHVMVYNEALFGNMYDTSMTLFLQK